MEKQELKLKKVVDDYLNNVDNLELQNVIDISEKTSRLMLIYIIGYLNDLIKNEKSDITKCKEIKDNLFEIISSEESDNYKVTSRGKIIKLKNNNM